MQSIALKLRPRFLRTFGKKQLFILLESWLGAHPRIYLASLTPIALFGYLLLLFFPLSSVVLIGHLISSWSIQNSLSMPIDTLIQLLAAIAAIGFSIPLFRLHFSAPQGYQLDSSDVPTLHKTIDELCQTYRINNFEQILLDESLDIHVFSSSKLAWPFKAKHSLVIGLPVLLCYSPEQFHAMLAKRIGQASGREQFFLLWLNSMSNTWQQYSHALAQSSTLALPLASLLRVYSQLVHTCSLFAQQLHELGADRYALDVTNDQDMAELFSQTIITENFLQQKYWPKINQLAHRQPSPGYLPYINMSKVMRNGLLADDIKSWLKTALQHPKVNFQTPSLKKRLLNIGYEKPRPPRRIQRNAGSHYLSKAILERSIDEFDQRWSKTL